ncbi:outer membrane lipid asymmetry maintenance protein MlaD [Zobellella denitrificans]|jgi:phospholipid/cholesterol/gamma-HCH transport system substrate-binding protein|uniref:ABC transporter substrate-binding protein n=1 Tax=Zobellella denitrificans TaxID=347534 RepID=A0A231N0H3_9GAMM|nr:outer membrane lipid asymmetry maintenance protein MlaD [Zobellella denitrificans]ATG75242.1 ABC transporter substrate-binding protein [Zobellella denitrificans]OXS15819.1 outer membrane lipid asymmetry maintenance protein MlaD [Zobellella denitrificans]
MKYSKLEFSVGCFMLAGIGALLLLAFKVAGVSLNHQGETYTLYAKFDNIGGLKVRSPVKVGGVVVGRVSQIGLDPRDQVPVVTLVLNREAGEFAESSTASILTSGLLGEQYLGLNPGFADEEMGIGMLRDGDTIAHTQSALVLEELIGKFIYSIGNN